MDKVNEIFPATKFKETITVTVSTVKQKIAGEVEVKYMLCEFKMPWVKVDGKSTALLFQTVENVGFPIAVGDTVYVTVK